MGIGVCETHRIVSLNVGTLLYVSYFLIKKINEEKQSPEAVSHIYGYLINWQNPYNLLSKQFWIYLPPPETWPYLMSYLIVNARKMQGLDVKGKITGLGL